MYIVKKAFSDLQDSNYLYDIGDEYPRSGLEVSPERIAELSGSNNLQGVPLIKAVKSGKVKGKKEEEA